MKLKLNKETLKNLTRKNTNSNQIGSCCDGCKDSNCAGC